jgi:alkylation response protein AidB-like acyl-CoA dehydrogenase
MTNRPSDDELDAFRARVRRVIAEHAPAGESREGHRAPTDEAEERALRAWYRTMYDEGLAGADWPAARGGRDGHHPLHHVIDTDELIRARVPRPLDQVQLASHVLLRFGRPEQLDRLLPLIRSGTDVWCQLFSEPDAGSDLAGIACRGVEQADGTYRLSGQKTWSTDAHWAQMGMALVRTGAGSTRHAGLTAFAVPMDAPGIEIRPMRTIGGAHEFNEVFLDDVVLGPDDVVGPVGEGWKVAMSGLEVERFGVGGNVALLDLLLADLVLVAGNATATSGAAAIGDAQVRHTLVALSAEAAAAQAFVADHIERALAGHEQVGDAPMAKVLYSECYNRIARFAVELIAEHRLPADGSADLAAQRLTDAWWWSRALTISGGSSEIMRNIIARRHLRLPAA